MSVNEMVEFEISFHHTAGIRGLGWRPDFPDHPLQLTDDGKLRGQYVLRVKCCDTNELMDIVATNN